MRKRRDPRFGKRRLTVGNAALLLQATAASWTAAGAPRTNSLGVGTQRTSCVSVLTVLRRRLHAPYCSTKLQRETRQPPTSASNWQGNRASQISHSASTSKGPTEKGSLLSMVAVGLRRKQICVRCPCTSHAAQPLTQPALLSAPSPNRNPYALQGSTQQPHLCNCLARGLRQPFFFAHVACFLVQRHTACLRRVNASREARISTSTVADWSTPKPAELRVLRVLASKEASLTAFPRYMALANVSSCCRARMQARGSRNRSAIHAFPLPQTDASNRSAKQSSQPASLHGTCAPGSSIQTAVNCNIRPP